MLFLTMKVISANIGAERTLDWKGKIFRTGIFKEPVDGHIYLQKYGVQGDHISNLKVHGGLDKACYSYAADYYDSWKSKYAGLPWTYGMFGENLTLTGLDEHNVLIGDVFRVSDAMVQVSQPRQPCNKFGAKFGDMKAIDEFIAFGHPGVYFRVIQEGKVRAGDKMTLDMRNEGALSVVQIFHALYKQKYNPPRQLAESALYDTNLAESCKKDIRRLWHIE